MAETIYILCAVTSALCAFMLLRGYARSRARLLLWSGLCFVFLFANNMILAVDRVAFPDRVLVAPVIRSAVALAGLMLLLYGLIWDAE